MPAKDKQPQHLTGTTRFQGEVPLAVAHGTAKYVGPHPAGALLSVNFGFPLRNRAALDRLIAYEAKTHHYLTRDQLYAQYSPPSAQLEALQSWLVGKGFRVNGFAIEEQTRRPPDPTRRTQAERDADFHAGLDLIVAGVRVALPTSHP